MEIYGAGGIALQLRRDINLRVWKTTKDVSWEISELTVRLDQRGVYYFK